MCPGKCKIFEFHLSGILTSEDSDMHVHTPVKLRNT